MKKSGLADSPFFQNPVHTERTEQDVFIGVTPERKSERTPERPNAIPNVRTEFRSVNLPLKRLTKRYSFEFYEDQIVQLKQLRVRAELEGRSLNLSQIVRHALDSFLEQQK